MADSFSHAWGVANFKPTIRAPAFTLLIGSTRCFACRTGIEAGALWVGAFEDLDEQAMDPAGAAILTYTQWLDQRALAACQARLPRLGFATTRTSGATYLANHCDVCGSIQGDHFVLGPDGPFWPGSEGATVAFSAVPMDLPLAAVADLVQASWMDNFVVG